MLYTSCNIQLGEVGIVFEIVLKCKIEIMIVKYFYIFLFYIIFFQGCVVYQPMPVSIDNAPYSGRVKVISNQGDVIYYRSIVMVDTSYYGIKGSIRIHLDSTQVSSIFLEDHYLSSKKTNNSLFIICELVDLVTYH